MEENNNQVPAPTPVPVEPVAVPPVSSEPSKKPFYKQVWFIILASILGLVFVVWPLVSLAFNAVSGGGIGGSGAGQTFYDMVETAAQKSKVHYAYESEQPAGKDADAVFVRSLAEYDAATKEYDTAYISENISARAERCVKGKEYMSLVNKNPDTLAEAEAAMRGEWKESTNRYPLGVCDYKKTRYQGSFTDGILPVGLTAAQAKSMVDALKGKDAIAFKDEGSATYDGKKGKKISFEISKEKTGKSNRANIFFYAFRDGATGETGSNVTDINGMRNNFETRYHATTPEPELKGYYIIDEKTKLPIYSELTTTAGGIPNFRPTTQLSVYGFPDALTMDHTTQLVDITKPE